MIPDTFDLAKWQTRIAEMYGVFRALDKYVSDSHVMRAYFEKEASELERSFPTDPSGAAAMAALSKRVTESYIADAAEVYRRQMIVIAATLFEAALRDFLVMLFVKHPMKMEQCLEDQEKAAGVNKVPLHQLVNAQTREVLLADLAAAYAARVIAKPFPRMFKVFLRVAGTAPKRVSESTLHELVEQRNRIVHEASEEKVSPKRVGEVFRGVLAFAGDIGDIAAATGITVQRPNEMQQVYVDLSAQL